MPVWAVLGDLHLGKLGHKVEDHLELQFATINKILNRVREHGIKTVVVLGDVFDTPMVNPYIVIRLMRFFRKNSDLEFVWIEGNHDRTAQVDSSIDIMAEMTQLKSMKHVTIITQPTKYQGGPIGFLPYPHKDKLKGTKLSFAHVDRPGAKRDNGSKARDGGDWDEEHYYVIGHIHTPQKIGKSYYTGSPYQLSFGEGVDKHWAIVTWDGSKSDFSFDYKRVPIVAEYELVNLVITKKKQLKDLKPHPTYYKLVFDGIDVPSNFLVQNPNCFIENNTISKTSIAEALASIEANGEIITVKPTFRLDSLLKEEGFEQEDIAWAIETVESLMQAA